MSRLVDHYNLDAIVAVGLRVRSARGTTLRQWAVARLTELLAKGFTLDDERIKAGRALGDDFFEELLARIRDIRSSERMFWQKVLDIYATSIDYDGRAEASQLFFKTVQNKMHWAVRGHTAAEESAEDDEEFGGADLEGVVDEPGPGSVVWQGSRELGVAESEDPGPRGGGACSSLSGTPSGRRLSTTPAPKS